MQDSPTNRRAAQPGYGLMLIMSFFMMLVMTALSLQATNGTPALMVAKRSVEYVSASNIAKTGLAAIRADIYSKLQAGNTVDTSYTYASTNISVPGDPSAIGTINSVVGSYSGSVKYAGTDTFLVQATGVAGNASVTLSELMTITGFSCDYVESQIKAGNIASLPDAALIKYAQEDCMLKPAPAGIAPYAVSAGSGANGACTTSQGILTGSGTLNYTTMTSSCFADIRGSYTAVYATTRDTTSSLFTYETGGNLREIDIGTFGNASGTNEYIYGMNNSTSTRNTSPVIYKFNNILGEATVWAGDGDDVISITGSVASINYGFGGNDTFIVNTEDVNNAQITELQGNAGDDTFYVKTMQNTFGSNSAVLYGDNADNSATYPGKDKFYVNSMGSSTGIVADAGDDVISCTGLFGTANCSLFSKGAFVRGDDGNDIVSIDVALTQDNTTGSGTGMTGGAGYNILYAKGITNTSSSYVVKAQPTTTGSSLLILGANAACGTVGCDFTATGSNNVLLIKTGATITGTTVPATLSTNYARILYY